MKEEFNSLDEKLLELKKKVCIMQKNADGYGYKYVTEDSILLVINDIMIDLGISLTPRFKDKTLYSEVMNYKDAKGKDKTDVLVRSEMQFVWKDIKTKEEIVIDWALLGQQSDASQALGSGLTYANRYFLLKYFNVATSNDDPDKIRNEIAIEEEKKKLSAIQTKIKKTFETLIQKYQSKDKVYEILGTNRDQFISDYNNKEKWQTLLEQMELVLKGDK